MTTPANPEYAQFDKLVQTSNLAGHDRKEAWKIFKEDGFEAAAAYVNAHRTSKPAPVTIHSEPLPYRVWGAENIDDASREQMDNAMRLPVALAGALMPDAHKGYGLPIGGVLATDNAVIPYAVGVDIACRMMLTVYPADPSIIDKPAEGTQLHSALMKNTTFGAGSEGLHNGKYEHPLLDESHWQATPLLRSLRQTAIYQIGTSGTGNHFVEWGSLTVDDADNPLNLQPGNYLALLSHSGSRGVGYKIADYYSQLAMTQMAGLPEAVKHLAWLTLDSEAGQEYWHAMHLAGEFASANHHLIHEHVAKSAGLEPIAAIENHHNFAWRETVLVDGKPREGIVHRKGATPAGKGVLGVIPGTMADTGYAVVGKGSADSLNSASHGGGRTMSRTQAKKTITPAQHAEYLRQHGVTLIGGGLDEAPQAYKRIEQVIGAQADLVQILGKFQPRLVRMATDTPPWKRKAAPDGIVDAEGD
jgi:tRNA-splicing ligase RtcB (3'-phosphate/5'-hydroxy nucleic acid ligase)